MFGEVGLGGELRSVNHGDRRLKEAAALGFRRALVPGRNAGGGAGVSLELTGTRTLMESIERCL
jgi:DNA repair protein RadA/Sms